MFRKLGWLLAALPLSLGMAAVMAAETAIVADPGAGAGRAPGVGAAANGVALVNIAAANAAGLSHNRYSQFDIGGRGAILNNGAGASQTALAGHVAGNPNLAGGSASVILNEVLSSNPSLLNGYLEVAGQRADVVIANPSGITVGNFGFINASKGILTTGTPQFGSDGGLTGYRVEGGAVAIGGQGFDASGTDFAGIYANAVTVNAGIWARDLTLATGQNEVSHDGRSVSHIGGGSQLSLDVAALGGMYANSIRLVGTESGMGVNNGGEIMALNGDLFIDQAGTLINAGVIHASGRHDIVAASIENGGRLLAGGDLSAEATAGDFDNQGEVAAVGSVNLAALGDVVNAGAVKAEGDLTVNGANLDNSGEMAANGALTLDAAGDLANGGIINSRDAVSLSAGDGFTNAGTVVADAGIAVDAAGDFDNQGYILTSGDFALAVGGDAWNRQDAFLVGGDVGMATTGSFENRGVIDAGNLVFRAAQLKNLVTGAIFGDTVSLYAADFLNGAEGTFAGGLSGLIASRGRLDLAGTNLVNREDGRIYAGGDMYIGGGLDLDNWVTGAAASFVNSSAVLEATGDITAWVNDFQNLNAHYSTSMVYDGTGSYVGYYQAAVVEGSNPLGLPNYVYVGPGARYFYLITYGPLYKESAFTHERGAGMNPIINGSENNLVNSSIIPVPGALPNAYFKVYFDSEDSVEIVDSSRAAFINTGGNLTITGNLSNDKSYLLKNAVAMEAVGADLQVSGAFSNVKANLSKQSNLTEYLEAYAEHFFWDGVSPESTTIWTYEGSVIRQNQSSETYATADLLATDAPQAYSVASDAGFGDLSAFTALGLGDLDIAGGLGNGDGHGAPSTWFDRETNPIFLNPKVEAVNVGGDGSGRGGYGNGSGRRGYSQYDSSNESPWVDENLGYDYNRFDDDASWRKDKRELNPHKFNRYVNNEPVYKERVLSGDSSGEPFEWTDGSILFSGDQMAELAWIEEGMAALASGLD